MLAIIQSGNSPSAVPWLFSWTGVIVAFVGLYIFGTLGISLCFHR